MFSTRSAGFAEGVEDPQQVEDVDHAVTVDVFPTSLASRDGAPTIDQAEKIVHDLEIGDPEVLQALKSGKGTLLTKSFFKEYRKELDRIYTD